MSNNAKVSILMGIYNCEDTLEEAINSILNQTHQNFELIMCDDCSADNTYDIARKYKDKYPDKIVLLRNDKNMTLAPTLNKCLKEATGEYVARQDGDDYSELNRLEVQVKYLSNNLDCDLVGTNMISFDSKGKKGIHRLKSNPDKHYYLTTGRSFAHATILMKKSTLEGLNGYCEDNIARQAEDYELWARFLENGFKGVNLDENLYWVREDTNAYKRRNVKRRIRGIKLNWIIYRRMKAPLHCYKMIFKDLLCIIIPLDLLRYYYRKVILQNK